MTTTKPAPETPPEPRTPNVHFLKSWPESFAVAKSGAKTFETRIDDRTPRYETGDVVVLQEFDPEQNAHTGSGWLVFVIGHIDRGAPMPDEVCSFSLKKASGKHRKLAAEAAMSGKGSR